MKKKSVAQKSPKSESLITILKKLTKRIEDAAIDIHDIRFDLKSMKLKLGSVEHNIGVMKLDIENNAAETEGLRAEMVNMRKTLLKIDKEIIDLSVQNGEILSKMVTQDELKDVSHRVKILEHD